MLVMVALISTSALAGRYNSLEFTSNTGETYTVATEDLEILVEGDNLSFNNTDLTIPLTSLVSMEFGDFDIDTTEVESISVNQEGAVTVYNLNGTSAGTFNSYTEALAALRPGLYVIKDANGNSLKVNVEK